MSEPFVDRGRVFETDWLTAPSTDSPHINPDVIVLLCQTRQYGFESRQSSWRLLLAFWRGLNGAQIGNPVRY